MRIVGLIGVFGAVAIASGASAQVTGVVTGGTTTVTFPSRTLVRGGQNFHSQVQSPKTNQYANYQVISDLSPNAITFANNVSATGGYTFVSSSTKLRVTFKNPGTSAITPTLLSTIDPGGFGVYGTDNLARFANANMKIADINKSTVLSNPNLTLNTYRNKGDPYLAGASFSITIASGGQTLETMSGLMLISPSTSASQPFDVTLELGGDAGSLVNFGLATPVGDDRQVGYQWDTTNLNLTLPGGPLAPGKSESFTYDTTVTAFTDGNLPFSGCVYWKCATLFSYSGFGDPLGRGVGGNASVQGQGKSPPTGVNFSTFQFGLPTFNPLTGQITFETTGSGGSLPLTPAPEPATWALMLLGVGGVGAALRRRTRRAAA